MPFRVIRKVTRLKFLLLNERNRNKKKFGYRTDVDGLLSEVESRESRNGVKRVIHATIAEIKNDSELQLR